MIYIIDHVIKFNTVEGKLYSQADPRRFVSLTTPAARCLTLLLENSPEIVYQDNFINQVWGQDGIIVSSNTLYQNISMIRRGLRDISDSDAEYIKTIIRKGFQFNIDIFVERLDEISTQSEDKITPTRIHTKNIFLTIFLALIVSIAGLITGRYVTVLIDRDNESYTQFDKYPVVANYNGCTILYDDHEINSTGAARKFIDKINHFDVDCKKEQWIYISAYSAGPDFTALICKKKIEPGTVADCESIHYRKDSLK